jgi:transposase
LGLAVRGAAHDAAVQMIDASMIKIKQCGPIATRYDKRAADYLAFIKLASIRLWLRRYKSTS